jgi:prepilin-type processing-associated H-X9-DG protein
LLRTPALKVTQIRTTASSLLLAGDAEWGYYDPDWYDARMHDPNRSNILFLDNHVSYMVFNSDPNAPDTQDWTLDLWPSDPPAQEAQASQ